VYQWSNPFATARCVVARQYQGREAMLRDRDRSLRRLIAHAYANVPYYRRLFDRAGVRPRDIRTAADLQAIPITTKDDLRAVPLVDRIARGLSPTELYARSTSGFSGTPFTVLRTRWEQLLTFPIWLRAMRSFGLRVRDRRASVSYVHPGRRSNLGPIRPILNGLGVYRRLQVDCRLPAGDILRALRRCRPDFLGGYSGTIAHLAAVATDRDRRLISPRIVSVGAEVLTNAMRRQIRDAFGAPVYVGYGSLELNLIAWECTETGELHTCDDGVVIEVLKDGRPAEPGETGELVGTNLYSYAMPFIRYAQGDVVTRGAEACACGQPFSTIHGVQGRILDYFTLPDGRRVHPYAIADSALDTARWIRRFQIVQERTDRIVMHVVPSGEPSQQGVEELRRSAACLFGSDVEFRVEFVPELEPEPTGKFRLARSLLGTQDTEGT